MNEAEVKARLWREKIRPVIQEVINIVASGYFDNDKVLKELRQLRDELDQQFRKEEQ